MDFGAFPVLALIPRLRFLLVYLFLSLGDGAFTLLSGLMYGVNGVELCPWCVTQC